MKVLVTFPTVRGVHKRVAMTALNLQRDARHETRILYPSHRPFENNLHHIVSEWIDERDEAFWLSIDEDNPPIGNPLDLVSLDLDIVGCPTPVWHYTGEPKERPIYWNAYKRADGGYTEWPKREGLQKVDAIGTGCFMVARRVFEHSEMRKAPFQRTFYEDGRVEKGNDIAFCERAKACGFQVWAHYDYPCRHFVELELTEVQSAFRGLYE